MKRLLPFLLFTAGIALCVWSYFQITDAFASSSWPSVQGEITGSVVKESVRPKSGQSGLRKKKYRPEIAYEYTVEETVHEAGRVSFGEGAYSTRSPAHAIQSRYPLGKNVPVYYDPADPKSAVLEPGMNPKAWLLPVAGIVLLIFGVLAARKRA